MATQDDDEIYFFGEDVEQAPQINQGTPLAIAPWKVLMIDDAPEVHQVTRLVLRAASFLDRPIEFISAYSAAEGRTLIEQHPDAAVVFLDVVMETDHAGLEMVKFIREKVNNKLIRIILRTGQSGLAPETEVIQHYDINDYKDKSELSDDRLLTTLIVALRSYNDIVTIEQSRRGLEQILHSSTELMQVRSTEMFLSGLLKQLQVMFNFGQDAILCARSKPDSERTTLPAPMILAGSGHYEHMVGDGLNEVEALTCKEDILHAFESGRGSFTEGHYSIYFYSRDVFEIVILFESPRAPTAFDNTLVSVFCNTAAISLSNIHLLETLEQKVDERTDALSKANLELQIMASTDMLTNIHNRRSLFELGNKQLQIARRYERPLTLIIMDVDHFKNINDTYGHAVGDLVLKHIAKACKSLLRSADILGRYGGEEFVALFPETDIDGSAIIAERLRTMVQNLTIPEINDFSNVTISLGVATLLPSDTDISQTISRADKALYQAKQQGRNKVIFFQA
ncbi:MAG TPA: diguanylate cyclase [Burkholderiaceae bacterium]|jgi:diguanylate cyclase (GGDEF)-like protein